jgi:serine/threonine protein phosphatase PrpC
LCVTAKRELRPGDALIVCTDGLWSGVSDELIATLAGDPTVEMAAILDALANAAVKRNAPHSDNTSACGMRWAVPQ